MNVIKNFNNLSTHSQIIIKYLMSKNEMFLLCSATREDLPIEYVSQQFTTFTGYEPEEIINKNCRFLQGKETEIESIIMIKNAILKRENRLIRIVNYKKNGEKFINSFYIAPVFSKDKELIYFIGIQKELKLS